MPFTYALNDRYNDMSIGSDGKLATIHGAEEVRQRVIIALRHYWREYFLNVPVGVPWYELILGSKDKKQAEALIRRAVLEVPGVVSIINMSHIFANEARELSFDMRIEVIGTAGPSIEDIAFSIEMGG